MKNQKKLTENFSQPADYDLLNYVIAEFKDKILFPEKIKQDRDFLNRIKVWPQELCS